MKACAIAACLDCGSDINVEVPHCETCGPTNRLADAPCPHGFEAVAPEVDRVEAMKRALAEAGVGVPNRTVLEVLFAFDRLTGSARG